MKTRLLSALLLMVCSLHADDVSRVRDAVRRSTLNQAGTHPFHLKASFVPSRGTDASRTGEIEYWWESPTRYRREVRVSDFHQIEVVDGDRVWQKNEGTYFPEWLRETAVALIEPVPSLDAQLQEVAKADVKSLAGSTYFSWTIPSSNGVVTKVMGASIAITDSTGLLFYGGGNGWCGLYKNYSKFHDRQVPRIVSCGEVTATIAILEDLKDGSDLFDLHAPGGDTHSLRSAMLDEVTLRKNLIHEPSITWPTLQDGPFDGTLTTVVSLDREGNVRELGSIVTDNFGVSDAASTAIRAMHFRPFILGGEPVQVVSRITMSFKAGRAAGTENFHSAKNYFAAARSSDFLGNGSKSPYSLKAEFEASAGAGQLEKGEYEDIWVDSEHWRREAKFAGSRLVRSQDGEKYFQLADGKAAGLISVVFKFLEPLPDPESTYEADWKVRPDQLNGTKVIRLHAGFIKDDGSFDDNVRAYWLSNDGQVLKAHWKGLDAVYSNPIPFNSSKVARSVDVFKGTSLGLRIQVLELSAAPADQRTEFKLKGHEWKHQFTDEER